MEKSFKKIVQRVNDVIFDYSQSSFSSSKKIDSYKSVPSFYVKVFEYSNIGEGTCINCNPGGNTCVVVENHNRNHVNNGKNEVQINEESDEEEDGQNYNIVTQDVVEEEDGLSESSEDIIFNHNFPELNINFVPPSKVIGDVTGVIIKTEGQMYQRQKNGL